MMNKKTNMLQTSFMVLAFSTILYGCLDEHPKDRIKEDAAYDTPHNLYINTVATLYNYIGGNTESQGLQGTYRGVYDYNTFTTDEAMLPTRGGDWYDGGFWQNLYRHQWTAADNALAGTWDYLYKVVVLCNRSLAAIEARKHLLTDTQLAAYQAEVRAVRALFYYYIMDMFGNVPLVTEAGTAVEDVRQRTRGTVFHFIFNELQETAPLLPDAHSNQEGDYYGRITRPVAFFLLAKLALNAEVYTDDDWTDGQRPRGTDLTFNVDGRTLNAWKTVVAYCDKLTDAGYTLAGDYASNFRVHNEYSPENIFTIPMDKTLYTNQFQYLFRARHYAHGAALGMDAENGTSATLSTVKAYGYGTSGQDTRYDINFFSGEVIVDGKKVLLDNGQPLVYEPLKIKLDLSGNPYEKTAGARMWKYEIDRTAHADGKLQDNDIVLFRYADAVLMKAEAKLRDGEDGSVELNQVRARAGMPARPCTLHNILEERLLELMWEGWRRQDLIRFGLFTTAYDQRTPLENESSGYTTVFPIPAKVLELNGNLKQNPGYSY